MLAERGIALNGGEAGSLENVMAQTHGGTGNREEIETGKGAEKRYVRRDEHGHFTDDQVDEGRSLSADRRHDAKTEVKEGQGDRGDRA